uniref:Uncharacterized protein n=1 Tax=Solanum demissum TaxID=50514 RepID=Q0KIS0_SOLDE|nr:hypothetical protein SDM1_46t00008 [Solanum demissum]
MEKKGHIYRGNFRAHVLNEERIGAGAETKFSSDFKIQNLEQRVAGTKFSPEFQKIRTRQQAGTSWKLKGKRGGVN